MVPRRRVRTLRRDAGGAMPVLEAILVAVLVLTAIIFFTSAQRPTTGAEQGGIDLAKVAADTLQIMQARNFTGTGPANPEVWVTRLAQGDTPTAAAIDTFLKGILPSGSRYILRLDNGNGTLRLLPMTVRSVSDGVISSGTTLTSATAAFTAADQGQPVWGGAIVSGSYASVIPAGTTILSVSSATTATLSQAATNTPSNVILTVGRRDAPYEGRAAQVALVPNWSTFRYCPSLIAACPNTPPALQATSLVRVVYPGQVLDLTDALLKPGSGGGYACFEAPFGSATAPGGTPWNAYWQSAIQTGTPGNGKDNATYLTSPSGSVQEQVPKGVPYGKWRLSTSAAVSGHCTGGTVSYLLVAAPGSRAVSQAVLGSALTSSALFSNYDVGLPVKGANMPANAFIASVTSGSVAVISPATTSAATGTIPAASTSLPYSLQLVVWFGA